MVVLCEILPHTLPKKHKALGTAMRSEWKPPHLPTVDQSHLPAIHDENIS